MQEWEMPVEKVELVNAILEQLPHIEGVSIELESPMRGKSRDMLLLSLTRGTGAPEPFGTISNEILIWLPNGDGTQCQVIWNNGGDATVTISIQMGRNPYEDISDTADQIVWAVTLMIPGWFGLRDQ